MVHLSHSLTWVEEGHDCEEAGATEPEEAHAGASAALLRLIRGGGHVGGSREIGRFLLRFEQLDFARMRGFIARSACIVDKMFARCALHSNRSCALHSDD